MMPNAGLEKLTAIVTGKSIPLKVHFSLHSPFSDERKLLLPRTTVGVEEAFEMLAHYRKEVSGIESIQAKMKEFHAIADPTEIHYTLIDQVNDTDRHLKRMIELLDLYRIPLKLIRFNPPEGMQRSKKEGEWLSTLQKSLPGLRVVEYEPPGKQIGSSCGEFTKHYYLSELETEEEKKEFLEWKQEHQIFE
jgi:adenine C2-methylase RlmN of 23S rRNA A2503 and tRNA A37